MLQQLTRRTLSKSNGSVALKALAQCQAPSTGFVRTKWTSVTPEGKKAARQRVLEEFAKRDLSFRDDWNVDAVPDTGILEHYDDYASLSGFQDDEDDADSSQPEEEEFDLRKAGLISQIVSIDRVQKPVTQGNILKFRALVVVGNEQGAAGYAIGKALSVPDAIMRAERKAAKRLTFIDRYDGRTLYHRIEGKFNSCKLFIQPTREGHGKKASDVVNAVLTCFGLTDVSSKVHGQRNPFTVIRAAFNAIEQHETAEDVAIKTGRRFVDMNMLAKSRQL